MIGFAAETENVETNAKTKLAAKGCDWILANDVSAEHNIFGGDENTVTLFRLDKQPAAWPILTKLAVAERLVQEIAGHFTSKS